MSVLSNVPSLCPELCPPYMRVCVVCDENHGIWSFATLAYSSVGSIYQCDLGQVT